MDKVFLFEDFYLCILWFFRVVFVGLDFLVEEVEFFYVGVWYGGSGVVEYLRCCWGSGRWLDLLYLKLV